MIFRPTSCLAAHAVLLIASLGSKPLGMMVQGRTLPREVITLKCSKSTLEGYDFQVEPTIGFMLSWGLSPDLEEISFMAVLNAEFLGWTSLGFSSYGSMLGSDAVVGIPSQGTIIEYDLNSRSAELIDPSPQQEVTEGFVEVSNGQTFLGFTRPTHPIGTGKLSLLTEPGQPTIILWAFGPGDELSYHYEGRGAIELELSCSSLNESEVYSGFPTPAPMVRTEVLTVSPTASPTTTSMVRSEVLTASPTASPTPTPMVRIEMLTASPTGPPTASPVNAQQPLDDDDDDDDDDTSGAVRVAPSVPILARCTSGSGVGGWAGSVGAVFGLAIGVVAAALAA